MFDNIPVSYRLGKTLKAFKNRLMTEFKENNVELSFELFVTLHILSSENENPTQQDIANHLQKDKSFILRQINTLIEKQYVVRSLDDKDKRKKKLIVTKKGEETLSFLRNIGKNVERKLLAGIDKETLTLFCDVLERIQANAGLEEEYYQCKFSR